jgi:hypothetical protein
MLLPVPQHHRQLRVGTAAVEVAQPRARNNSSCPSRLSNCTASTPTPALTSCACRH